MQSGDPRPDGALLWTQLLGSGPLRVQILELDPGGEPERVLLEADAEPEDGGFVHLPVEGLEADRAYGFTFVAESPRGGAPAARSAIGRFRTAPAAEARRIVRFGATSCIKAQSFPLDVLPQAARDDLDFFVLGGDTVYADGSHSLDDYREFWRDSLSTEAFIDLFGSTAMVASWDDHEVENNWDPETIDPAQRAAATQAFFEHMAIRRDPDHPDRIWRSLRFGQVVELFVLDCRSERRPSTRRGAEAEYISPAQLDWLEAGLLSSEAVFKVVVNSVPISDMPLVFVNEDDRWEGYAAQRTRLLARVGEVPGLLFLAGDFHFGAVARLGPPGSAFAHIPEVLAGPAAQLPNPAWLVVQNGLRANQFPFLTGVNNYTRFTCEPDARPPRITVEFIDGSGAVVGGSELLFSAS